MPEEADRHAAAPLFVAAGEGIGGVKVRAVESGGAFGLVETVIHVGHSTPLHVHCDEDEAFYVLSGAVELRCGERSFRAEAGAFALLPRGVPHTFLGVGGQDARVLVMFIPGGLEEAFAEPHRFDQILRAHNVEIVGPPLSA
jgi:mannose-6-phosphate isomerase-like protein (cupin superfamily)